METFIKNLARGAGKILREGFGKELEIKEKKGFWDIATQYDLAAEKFVSEKIIKKYPNHGILGEENGHTGSKKHFWIIDPLDGTRNFSRGIPFFCAIIAFVSGSQLKLGTVYDPIHDEMFFARKNGGASLNGRKITVGSTEKLEAAMSSLVWDPKRVSKRFAGKLQNIILDSELWQSSLASGGLTLAYVASGRLDFVLNAYFGRPWDWAAGALIAKEAGAKVTDIRGKPYRWNSDSVVTANPVLHKKIIEAFKK